MIQVDQGYSVFQNVFAQAEMLSVGQQLADNAVQRTKAGARHVLNVAVVRDLSADPRMLTIARQFVGAGAVPFRATLFDKSPTANWLVVWHQDTALPMRQRFERNDWGPWSTKAGVLYAHAPAWALEQVIALRVSLDDSSRTARCGYCQAPTAGVYTATSRSSDSLRSRHPWSVSPHRAASLRCDP